MSSEVLLHKGEFPSSGAGEFEIPELKNKQTKPICLPAFYFPVYLFSQHLLTLLV